MGMAIAAGSGLVFRGVRQKNSRLVVLGIAIGLTPILIPAAINRSRDSAREGRRAAVAAMPREVLASAYPHQMLFRGDLAWVDVARLMILTDLDQLLVENGNGTVSYSRPDHSLRCRAATLAAGRSDDALVARSPHAHENMSQSEQWNADRLELLAQMRRRAAARQIFKHCGPADRRASRLSATYLLVRTDATVTRRARDRRAIPQAIQIDLIENGREHLIHYDEMPVADARFSTLALPLDSPRYPCPAGFDDAQIIANVLDAAREPGNTDALMAREGARYTCVLSRPPT